MSTPSENINLSLVLSETWRIIKSKKTHFFILSLLFLLPLSILLFYFPTIIFSQFQTTSATPNSIFLIILSIISTYVLSIYANCTITYITFHGYYTRPVEFIPALKSLSTSFIKIFSTSIVISFIVFSIGLVIGIVVVLSFYLLGSLVFSNILMVLMFFACSRFLQQNWYLYSVVVVMESKWGYEALRRSAYLMEGMGKIKLKLTLVFGLLSLFVVPCYWSSWTGQLDEFWMMVLKMVVGACGMTVLMVYALAANVVLYIYCKKMHGELDLEIQEEEYVSLTIGDDGKKFVDDGVHVQG